MKYLGLLPDAFSFFEHGRHIARMPAISHQILFFIYLYFSCSCHSYLTSVHTCDEYELHKLFPFSRSSWPITFLQFARHSPSSTSRLSPLHITHSTLSSSECCGAMKNKKLWKLIFLINANEFVNVVCVRSEREEWRDFGRLTHMKNLDIKVNIERLCANISHFATVCSFSPRIYTISNFPIFTYLSFIDLAVNTRWINDDIHQVDGERAPSPTPKKWLNTPVRFRKYAVECQISSRTRVSTLRRPVQSNIQCV